MTAVPDRAKIVEKVAKLKAHAASAEKIGSELEAQAFAAAMQRLMSEHKILMSEVEHANLDETDPMVRVSTSGFTWQDGKRKHYCAARVEWMEHLAYMVAKAHYCKNMIVEGTAVQVFFGRRNDTSAALETFEYMAECAARLAWAAYGKAYAAHQRGEGPWQRGFQKSFLLGFAQRLGQRYDEEMERMKSEWANSGTALVRLKDAMTAVNNALGPVTYAKKTRRFTGVENQDAYEKGQRAANDVRMRGESKRVGA